MILRWADIPKYWIWYAYIDFLRYAWGGLMINEFEGRRAMIGSSEVLEYYSLDNDNKWLFMLYQFLFLPIFAVATWAALHGALVAGNWLPVRVEISRTSITLLTLRHRNWTA